jgi:hypothetical protein
MSQAKKLGFYLLTKSDSFTCVEGLTQMNIRDIGKRIMLDFFASFPWTGAIAREWDTIENGARFKKIESEISEILDRVGRNAPVPLEDSAQELLRIVENNGLAPGVQFRKAELCMLLLKQLSNRSELGQANDPRIEYNECVQIVSDKINGENAQKELGLAVYELEKSALIYKHISATRRSAGMQ